LCANTNTLSKSGGGERVIPDDLTAAARIEPLLVLWSFEMQMMTPRPEHRASG
jgi:hypothetical protein